MLQAKETESQQMGITRNICTNGFRGYLFLIGLYGLSIILSWAKITKNISERNLLPICKQYIRIFNGYKVRIENAATRVTGRNQEEASWYRKVSQLTEFLIRTEQPLWILFLAYISFDNCKW